MKSRVYRLVKPFEVVEETIERELRDGWVLIKPEYASICHADLRYFTGNRRPEALAKKLPMALIHEGTGIIIDSKDDRYQIGERVAIVPNIPGRLIEPDKVYKESDQYSKHGVFMGSGYDGIAQSVVAHPGDCLVKIPEGLSNEIAVLSEVSSVSVSAVRCIEKYLDDKDVKVALFGDGPVGFMTAAYLSAKFGLDKEHFTVFGADDEKLKAFYFATTHNVLRYDFENSSDRFNIVIECTGGKFSESAINQGIKIIERLGHLVLMGVTEDLVPINTRDILEKGLSLYGSSRSVTSDFQTFIDAVEDNESYQEILRQVLPDTVNIVKSAEDFSDVMNEAASKPHWKKVIMKFEW